MLRHHLPPHQVNSALGNSCRRVGRLSYMNQTTENKQTDLLFPFLPASVAVYQGKARMEGKKKKKNKKKLLLNFLIVFISKFFCAEF